MARRRARRTDERGPRASRGDRSQWRHGTNAGPRTARAGPAGARGQPQRPGRGTSGGRGDGRRRQGRRPDAPGVQGGGSGLQLGQSAVPAVARGVSRRCGRSAGRCRVQRGPHGLRRRHVDVRSHDRPDDRRPAVPSHQQQGCPARMAGRAGACRSRERSGPDSHRSSPRAVRAGRGVAPGQQHLRSGCERRTGAVDRRAGPTADSDVHRRLRPRTGGAR